MPHHGEPPRPAAHNHPQREIADVFLRRGGTGTVFIQALTPVCGPGGFDPRGLHEFTSDASGRGVKDIIFLASFCPAEPSGQQPLHLQLLSHQAAEDRDAAGEVLAPARTGDGPLGWVPALGGCRLADRHLPAPAQSGPGGPGSRAGPVLKGREL